MTAAETCYVLRSLEIDQQDLRFSQALLIILRREQRELWSIVVFGVDVVHPECLPDEVQVVAVTRRGCKLSGPAHIETVSPGQHYLGLLGVGSPAKPRCRRQPLATLVWPKREHR